MAVLGNLLFARVWGTGERPTPTYTVGMVSRQTVTSITNASGTVSATRQVWLSAPTAGRVARLSVKQGDQVQEGQEIAVLDGTAL